MKNKSFTIILVTGVLVTLTLLVAYIINPDILDSSDTQGGSDESSNILDTYEGNFVNDVTFDVYADTANENVAYLYVDLPVGVDKMAYTVTVFLNEPVQEGVTFTPNEVFVTQIANKFESPKIIAAYSSIVPGEDIVDTEVDETQLEPVLLGTLNYVGNYEEVVNLISKVESQVLFNGNTYSLNYVK